MSGIFLKDGARVIGVGGEPGDDLADMVVMSTAEKVYASAHEKFSRMTFMALDREISVWDSFCHSCFRNGGIVRNRIIVDFLRATLLQHIDDMSDEMRWLIEFSACDYLDEEDEDEELSREIVSAVIQAEVNVMVRDHGRALQVLYMDDMPSPQPMLKGASPA